MEIREEAKLGSGARFKALKKNIASKGNVRDPGAVAASIGRAKYGKAKFQKLAAAGHHESQVPALGAAEAAELSESCKKCGSQSHSAEQCPMNKMARGLDRSVIPPAKACLMREDEEKCPYCGGPAVEAGKAGLYRCKRCKKTFSKRSDDPLMGEAIVDHLLNEYPDPQSELSLHDHPRALTTDLGYHGSPYPEENGPWGRIVQRARERRQAEEQRRAAAAEQAKYRSAMTRPKADVMPGGGSMQLGDTTAIGSAGGGY